MSTHTTLTMPASGKTLTNTDEIQSFLETRGIIYDQWHPEGVDRLEENASSETVLQAYQHAMGPYMSQHGYQTADVVVVNENTPGLPEIREKFLREHTHSEDEVRFFVAGQGHFWFHLETPTEEVFCVTCTAGSLLSVPAGVKHWFDLGHPAQVKVIRMFMDPSGWIPLYTESGIEKRFHLPSLV